MSTLQVCSKAQADVVVAKVTATGIGKGVKELYIPEWAAAPNGGPLSPGETEDLHPFTLRMNNGTEGFNCGLLREFMKMFPSSWPDNFAAEVENQAKFAAE